MIVKLLEEIEKNVNISGGCGDLKRILNTYNETLYCAEYSNCEECKKYSLKVIAKLKEEALEQSKALDKLNKIEEIIDKLGRDVPDVEHFNDVDNYCDLMNYVEEIRKVLVER